MTCFVPATVNTNALDAVLKSFVEGTLPLVGNSPYLSLEWYLSRIDSRLVDQVDCFVNLLSMGV